MADPVAHGRRRLGPNPVELVRDQYRRQVSKTPDIRMVPGVMRVSGRRLRFAVSDNEEAFGPEGPGSPPIWAVNIHGYFAGGAMYWRESARVAERLGWRVVNPSLPGFGGSDPFEWNEVTIEAMAEQVRLILERVGAGPVVLLGHSMGGAVAVRYAHDHPENTLGILYPTMKPFVLPPSSCAIEEGEHGQGARAPRLGAARRCWNLRTMRPPQSRTCSRPRAGPWRLPAPPDPLIRQRTATSPSRIWRAGSLQGLPRFRPAPQSQPRSGSGFSQATERVPPCSWRCSS